jgi:NTP pyrophosphatase (non-canonical NTP hydrolase)
MPCKYKKSCGWEVCLDEDCPEFVAKKRGEPFVGEEKTMKIRPSRTAIEKKAIEVYTRENQVIKTLEEIGELARALSKHLLCQSIFPPPELKKNIKEEIADVQIMLDQMQMIFGDTLIEQDAKLTRLAGRLGMMEVSE